MTGTEVITKARRLARTTTTGASDAYVQAMVNDGMRQFAVDVAGLPLREYLTLSEKFTTRTNFALAVEIVGGSNALTKTTIAITGTNRDNVAGAQVATDLQTAINTAIGTGTVTVTYTDYYFTVAATGATSISFSSPTGVAYIDATKKLGLLGTVASASFKGEFPEECTISTTLPTDLITIESVVWDETKLLQAPSGIVPKLYGYGLPVYFDIRGREVRLFPAPTSQKEFYIEYFGTAPEIASFAAEITAIPEVYHDAISYWVAHQLLLENHEPQLSSTMYQMYWSKRTAYQVAFGSNRSKTYEGGNDELSYQRVQPWRVVT